LWRALALAVAVVLTSSGQALADGSQEGIAIEVTPPSPIWSINYYNASVVRDQDPDYSACTAAAAMSMLNLVALSSDDDLPLTRGSSLPQLSFVWQVDTSYDTQERILEYERENMTMVLWALGTDPHGWRNALNYFGWGSMRAGVYADAAYTTFDDAAWAAVRSLARTGKPVGILGWFGGHAQYVTGYRVKGEDPRVSDNYTILGVYLTDPLQGDDMANTFVTYSTWKDGPLYLRFSPYYQNESPYKDPIDGHVGYTEWWGNFVIIDAVK
jgi:hypothetical protein